MEAGRAAELQVLLEGVQLPAEKQELLAYAEHEGADGWAISALRSLPDREFESLDEVGEELAPVAPRSHREVPHQPKEESGAPPGGDAYTA